MSSIATQYLIDNEQDRSKYRRFNSRGNITGLVLVTREFIPSVIPDKKEKNKPKREIEDYRKTAAYRPYADELETLKVEILIPQLSRRVKARFEENLLFEKDQEMDIRFDHIKGEEVKKYLSKEEKFTVPSSGSVAKIIVTGLPADYSALEELSEVDNFLGFPDWQSEKPHQNNK